MSTAEKVAVLVEAVNNPTRAAPLGILAFIKYPGREVQPCTLPDGTIQFSLTKWGWAYKSRQKKPSTPPPADTAAIQSALNTALAPGYTVQTVIDEGKKIIITMEEKNHEKL